MRRKAAGAGTSPLPLFPASPIPRMPEGYYSGDKPNPNLRAFVEAHLKEHPYDPATDTYDVPAFDRPIETTKATAIYNMHTYWSKKPHDAIRQYIRHYTQPGDLVIDPFCGSGSTALAALMEGRKAIAIDRSPAATFITKNYCTPVDVNELQAAFEELKQKAKPEIDWLYETRCDRCGGKATVLYSVYSQTYQCPRCFDKVALFDCPKVPASGSGDQARSISVCPRCFGTGHVEEIGPKLGRKGLTVVAIGYECQRGAGDGNSDLCTPKRGSRNHQGTSGLASALWNQDIARIADIDGRVCPYPVPGQRMMNVKEGHEVWGLLWRPYHKGIVRVSDFFSRRNLWALLALREAVSNLNVNTSTKDFMLGGVSAILLKCSLLMGWGKTESAG